MRLLCTGLCLGLAVGTIACRQAAPEVSDTDSAGSTDSGSTDGTENGSDSTGADVEEPDGYKKSLKILAIGNSFADDALWYAAQTAKSLGSKNVNVGILYIGGCSIQQHAQNSASNARAYTYRKTTDGKWTDNDGKTLLQGLTDEDWDFISIQQASGTSGLASSYDASLDTLTAYVNAHKTNAQAKLVFHMTWAYQGNSTHEAFPRYNSDQTTMYNAIVQAVEMRIVESRGETFDAVIPVGTAIQNVRTSFIGDTVTRDGYHLNGLGRAVAAAAFIGAITGWPLDGLAFIPVGYDRALLPLIVESARNAVATPFAVTPSAYTQAV